MSEFRMPSLGADMEAGTLVEWLVKPGERVKRGDVIAVVETQKGAIEIEVFQDGRVEQLLVDIDAKVPVGTPLARIRANHEPVAPPAAEKRPVSPVAPVVTATLAAELAPLLPQAPTELGEQAHAPAEAPAVATVPAANRHARVSPAARRLAEKHRITLSAIVGSGPAGAVTYADVERHIGARSAPPEKKRAAGLDLDAMRTAIAAAMARSNREIPHYYLQHQVDVSACREWLAAQNANRPPDSRLLFGAIAVKSVASAVRRFPAFNGFFRDDRFKPSSAVHVGFAIAIRGGGLAAPALHDTDQLALDELMAQMRDLVRRTRAGRIRGSEMSDPTITVSSLGERGVEALYGIIFPPQVAIVGFGKVVARPWVVDGEIGPRSVVTITLSADHRVSDGHAGALFLAEIGKVLQEPEKL